MLEGLHENSLSMGRPTNEMTLRENKEMKKSVYGHYHLMLPHIMGISTQTIVKGRNDYIKRHTVNTTQDSWN